MNNAKSEPPNKGRMLARKALDQAATELERALYNMGYQAGWEAAVKKLTETSLGPAPEAPALVSASYDDSPAKQTVIRFLRENPGHRGSEIVEALREGSGIKGTTTRTAIFRLKEADFLRNDGGKWYINNDKMPEEEVPSS